MSDNQRKIPIYMVEQPTGLFSKDGIEFVVLVGAKLTRKAADELSTKNPGSRVIKLSADK